MERDAQEIKCIAVKMPVSLVRRVEQYKDKTGKSKNAALVRLIEIGLDSS